MTAPIPHNPTAEQVRAALVLCPVGPDDLPGDWRIAFENLAHRLEHDYRLPREQAEFRALVHILRKMHS